MDLHSKVELETLNALAGTLTFYQLLKISPIAGAKEIQDAFHREALEFHPDRYLSTQDAELVQLAKSIYSVLVKAYRTLSNSEKRIAYDQELKQSGKSLEPTSRSKRSTPSSSQPTAETSKDDEVFDENEITAVRQKPQGAATSAGLRFYKMAQTAYSSRDLAAARMNIQIALNTDPKNPEFLQLSQRIDNDLARAAKK